MYWIQLLLIGFSAIVAVGLIAAVALVIYFQDKILPEFPVAADGGRIRNPDLDRWVQSIVEQDLFNGAILIVEEDEILLQKACGFCDPDSTEPLAIHHSFQLASLSKQFTAAAIMALQEDGNLAFNDPISHYLPEIPWKDATLRHLLNHTSGAPDYMRFHKHYSVEGPMSIQSVVRDLGEHYPKLETRPNERFAYSNTGYVLLAGIVERISGLDFAQFMTQRLFAPLGMHETRAWNLSMGTPGFPGMVRTFSNKGYREFGPLDGVSGDGGIYCSVGDFLIWDRALRDGTLLSGKVLQAAFTPGQLNDGSSTTYGFGWVLDNEGAIQWHNGSWLGANTYLHREPARKRLLVILDNASHFWTVDEMAKKIRRGLFEALS